MTESGDLIALDAKINLDGNALYRHPDLLKMRDISQEDPREAAAAEHDLNYITLDGNIGCMVNGAGLAMATMDLVQLHGGRRPTSSTSAAAPRRAASPRLSRSSCPTTRCGGAGQHLRRHRAL